MNYIIYNYQHLNWLINYVINYNKSWWIIFSFLILIVYTGLEASTSVNIENVPLDLVRQNFADAINWSLQDLTKNIQWNNNLYKLRGAIIFHGGERCGLWSATGHYTTSSLRSNKIWELYDDTKNKIISPSLSRKNDIELLLYSL